MRRESTPRGRWKTARYAADGVLNNVHIAQHRLESGTVLRDVPVAFQTWGAPNPSRDNAIVVCHTLTANTDVAAWWKALLGPGRLLDPERFFIICLNVPGSPYGSVAPLTENPATGRPYGPVFPLFTICDTVALHRAVLDRLGVRQVALAIGGSMGGMQVLEWAFHADFVRALAPIAASGQHSAWGIGWTEVQRQILFADPKWRGGHYPADDPPSNGLAAARMAAMLSYRSPLAYGTRFGRTHQSGAAFAVERYLHHQGEVFVQRFDANCFVSLTRQLNTHDVARGRGAFPDVLRQIMQPTLVVGIDSDVLYPLEEQRELVRHLPNARLAVLRSPHGHDAFLIEGEQLNNLLQPWLAQRCETQDALA